MSGLKTTRDVPSSPQHRTNRKRCVEQSKRVVPTTEKDKIRDRIIRRAALEFKDNTFGILTKLCSEVRHSGASVGTRLPQTGGISFRGNEATSNWRDKLPWERGYLKLEG